MKFLDAHRVLHIHLTWFGMDSYSFIGRQEVPMSIHSVVPCDTQTFVSHYPHYSLIVDILLVISASRFEIPSSIHVYVQICPP